jgi:hypothetical protein
MFAETGRQTARRNTTRPEFTSVLVGTPPLSNLIRRHTFTMSTSLTALSAGTPFVGTDATVADYWRFVLGDPRTNNARGYLAEFLVAKALGIEGIGRIEWADHDLLYGETKIEVKSTGTVQAWAPGAMGRSAPAFSGLMGKILHDHGAYASVASFNADVYVFAIETEDDEALYNPLLLEQWRFMVLAAAEIREFGQKSVRLSVLRRGRRTEFRWLELADAIALASASATHLYP